MQQLLSVHNEGQGNERSWCSYHAYPANLIACVLHMGMCHGKPEVRPKTSYHHEYIVLWNDLPFFPTCYKLQMLGARSSRETKSVLYFHFPFPIQVDQIYPTMYLSDKSCTKYLLVATSRLPRV
jgi:hypothetical protein